MSVTSATVSPAAASAGRLLQPSHYTELFTLHVTPGFKLQHQCSSVILTMALLTPRTLLVTQSAFLSLFSLAALW